MNFIHEAEREEARDARRHTPPFTGGGIGHAHQMRPDGLGGGICVRCGHVVDRDEL